MNKMFKLRGFPTVFSLLALIFVVIVSGAGILKKDQAETPDLYKPTKDFSFLKKFVPIYELFGEEQWTKEKGRSFDSNGIALTNGKFHPVNMCHYALFCYDEYKITGVERFKTALIAQAKLLMDSTFYHKIEDDKIAYPYLVNFHDLKPPWYSALAQSEAISVMIRYYALTKDPAALPIIIKLRNFMVYPQEGNCGTKSVTPEGYEWYEEYPNSNQEKQVLNGFLLAVVALYEFHQLFPNDKETYRLYKNSIETVKKSFQFYDSGSWLKYNRGDKRLVNNGYMKWQVLEFKLLYQITGDEYFKHMMMLVSSYCYNKPYAAPGVKIPDYDFSVPLKMSKTGNLYFEGKRNNIDLKTEVDTVNTNSTCKISNNDLLKLHDTYPHTFINLCATDSTPGFQHTMDVKFKKNTEVGGVKIMFAGFDSLDKPEVKIYFKSGNDKKLSEVKITETASDHKSSYFYFHPINISNIVLHIKHKGADSKLKIAELQFTQPPVVAGFNFCHYITDVYEGNTRNMKLGFDSKKVKDFIVFSKSSDVKAALDKERWNLDGVSSSNPATFVTNGKKFHRFLIIIEPDSQGLELKNLVFSNN